MATPFRFPPVERSVLALLGILLATCQPAAENDGSTAFPPPVSNVSSEPASGSLLQPTLAAHDALHVIQLETGEALHVDVEEHHLDVAVELYDPADQKILTFDSPTGGHGLESICFVAQTPGAYRLHVRAPDVSTGSYRLTRLEVTTATALDRDCWLATQQFVDAEARLGKEGTALIPRYRQAAQLWQRAQAPYREAIARMRLGGLCFTLGDLETEAESYQRSLALLELLGNRTHEQITVMKLLADARWRQGRIDETEALLAKALALAHQTGDLDAEVSARDQLALLKKSRGEAHLAVRELKKNLETWQREGQLDKEAESLHFLGQVYAEDLSKFPEAIDFLDRALEIWQRIGRSEEQAGTLILRGWASYRAGDPETAVGFFEAALKLAEASGHQPSAAAALDRLGTTYRALGRPDEARSAFERSLDMSRASGNLRNQAHTEANLGLLLIAHGEAVEGKARLEQALDLLRPLGERDAVAQVLVGLATAERTLGDLPAALRRYEQAMAQLDSLRLSARSAGGRLAPDPIWQEHYEGYVDLLIEVADHDGGEKAVASAFEIAELNRSRNLYEILLEAGIELREGADPELLRREQELLSQIDAVATQQGSSPSSRVSQRLRTLGLDLEEIRDRIRLSNPRFVEIRNPPKIDLAQIQALLDPKTHLLSIVLGPHRSFLFQVDSKSIGVRVLGARDEIERQARAVYAGLVRRAGPGSGQVGFATRALSDHLLGSSGLPPDASRLVIVTMVRSPTCHSLRSPDPTCPSNCSSMPMTSSRCPLPPSSCP
ncbi:MAG: tetratricopeptide repeat protein [Thermoanaerobaculia bacterium]|nr:tetratricopeptide repeat protein [Thermoanaerobaculia bacterium]